MNIVAYYRVSTDRQGVSRLGLEAQTAAVAEWCKRHNATIVQSFTEVESGRNPARPELAKALRQAKRTKSTLAVAKLDRLSRNARFLLGIVESDADVVFCDLPELPTGSTGKFFISMMAAVAELEAGLTAERTKAALAAYKARGGTLGGRRAGSATESPEMRQKASQAGSDAMRKSAIAEYMEELGIIGNMHASGKSLREIAEHLNSEGFTTRQGAKFDQTTVYRILKRQF